MNLNWQEYYARFSEIHGGEPIIYQQDRETGRGGYLLFSDGWMYARSDPSGPEYPPENDEDAIAKIKHYWRYRQAITHRAYKQAKEGLHQLVRLQQNKSAPLQLIEQTIVEDEDGKRTGSRNITVSVDFQTELDKLRGLWYDLQRCKEKLIPLDIPGVLMLKFSAAGILTEIEEIEARDRTIV